MLISADSIESRKQPMMLSVDDATAQSNFEHKTFTGKYSTRVKPMSSHSELSKF